MTIGIEIDPDVVYQWHMEGLSHIVKDGDTISFLKDHREHTFLHTGEKVFIYLDPPYLRSSRSHKEKLYRYEFWTEEQHTELLELLKTLKWNVAISHYRCPLYDKLLKGWRRIDFPSQTHRGTRLESLYMNYPEPWELHDPRFLGSNFREREKYHKQQRRWVARIKKMDAAQRHALLFAIDEARQQLT
jgi:hypothetical protein